MCCGFIFGRLIAMSRSFKGLSTDGARGMTMKTKWKLKVLKKPMKTWWSGSISILNWRGLQKSKACMKKYTFNFSIFHYAASHWLNQNRMREIYQLSMIKTSQKCIYSTKLCKETSKIAGRFYVLKEKEKLPALSTLQ